MNLSIKLAWREMLFRRKYYLLFALNIAFGLAGLIIVIAMNRGVLDYLNNNLREQLTADLEINSNKLFTADELFSISNIIPEDSNQAELINLISVIGVQKNQQFKTVQLIGLGDNYPLIGEMILQNRGIVDPNKIKELSSNNGVWINRSLAVFLNVNIGDFVLIGDSNLVIDDIVIKAPLNRSFSALIQRVYINKTTLLSKTNLITNQSRYNHKLFFVLYDNSKSDQLKNEINTQFTNSDGSIGSITARSFNDSSQGLLSLSSTTSEYLNALAMIAFILASMGSIYLFRYFFNKKKKDFAILKMLGMNSRQVFTVLGWQMIFQSVLACIFTIIIAPVVVELIEYAIFRFVNISFNPNLNWLDFFKISLIALVGLPIFCLPALLIFSKNNPADLFSDFIDYNRFVKQSKINKVLTYLPAIGLVLFVTFLVAPRINSYYLLIIIALLFVILYLISELILFLLNKTNSFFTNKSFWIKHTFLVICRYPIIFKQSFVAISAASIMLFLIPGIYVNIQKFIESPPGADIPQFFLFDIQEYQKDDVIKFFEDKNVNIFNIDPMINAKFLAVNDINIITWDEMNLEDDEISVSAEQIAERSNFNLNFKSEFNNSEDIIEGPTYWPKFVEGEVAKISIEKYFADQNNLKIGDKLTFSIDEQIVSGQVYNIRTVKWNYFYPNFFVVFQPGVLENFNKIFLANINGIETDNHISDVSFEFIKNFSNVPIIDVRQSISDLLQLGLGITYFLLLICSLTIITGLLALYGIILAESDNQIKRNNLFLILGTNWKTVIKMIFSQYLVIVLISNLISSFLAIGTLLLVGRYIFDSIWLSNIPTLIITLLGASGLIVGLMLFSSRSTTKKSPLVLFENQTT